MSVAEGRWAGSDGERVVTGAVEDLAEFAEQLRGHPLTFHDAKSQGGGGRTGLLAVAPPGSLDLAHDTMVAAYLIDPARRVYDLAELAATEGLAAVAGNPAAPGREAEEAAGSGSELLVKAHWAIDRVTRDLQDFQFHTAISAVMELVNEAYRVKDELYGDPGGEAALRFATATAASLMFPFAPHLGADVYEAIEGTRVWEEPWPEPDPTLLRRDTFTLVVQVNGKRRDQIEAAADAPEEELLRLARESKNVRRHLDGKEIVKEVVVPGKLINLVAR
jgi:leucyl-tRNA synthetase